MPIPNVHVRSPLRSAAEVWAMIVAYRLPLCIFVAATALVCGYNSFFFRLIREARAGAGVRGASVPVGAVLSLCLGDLLFALMYGAFLRAIFTCAGYVPAEPWRGTPQSDTARQQVLHDAWAAQRRALHEQATAARERAAQAQQLHEQQQRLAWQAYQAHLAASSSSLAAQLFSTGAAAGGVPPCIAPPAQHLRMPQGGAAVGAAALALTAAATAAVGTVAASAHSAAADADAAARAHSAVTGAGAFSRSASSASSPPASAETSSAALSGAPSGSSAAAAGAAAAAALTQRGARPSCEVAVPQPAAQVLRRLPCHAPAADAAEAGNPHWVFEYEADGALRFCAVCHLYKPDGSHHCRLCHRCVLDMDHHCRFLNNCVGRRNYKFFFLCIVYSTLCGTVNTALLVRAYVRHPVCRGWGHGWWWVPAGMFGIGAAVSYLSLQHVFLLVRGVSTLDRMSEVAAELFLERVTGTRRTACARPGTCAADCGMAIDECATAVLAPHVGTWMGHRQEGSAVPHRTSSSQEAALLPANGNAGPASAASSPPPPTRAERRARRWALLFGQPPSWVYHLLPLAPVEGPHRRGVSLRTGEV